jgi:glycosyltransferase involved in cell wall biosynthesis
MSDKKDKKNALEDERTISIIVPIFNAGHTLHRCVDSILAQTHRAIQVVLIDDGSTDGSGEICDLYETKDIRVLAIHKENGGVSSARNIGLKAATGAYVGFVDADDYIAEKMYERLILLLAREDADIAQCSFREVADGADVPIDERRIDSGTAIMRYGGEEGVNSLLSQHSFHASSQAMPVTFLIWDKLFRRRVIDGTPFNEQIVMAEDTLFVAEAITQSKLTIAVNEQLYYHTVSQYSLAHATSYNKMKGHMTVPGMYREIINRKFPQLAGQAADAAAFIYVAIYNRLLGNRDSFRADESKELEGRLKDFFRMLKKEESYPNIDFRLRAAMSLALRFPFANRVVAALFRIVRRIQYKLRYG